MSQPPPHVSLDEQKKAISVVLNQMKMKDLSGLLEAQRSNTLDEYLSPHIDAYISKKYANGSAETSTTGHDPTSTSGKSNPHFSRSIQPSELQPVISSDSGNSEKKDLDGEDVVRGATVEEDVDDQYCEDTLRETPYIPTNKTAAPTLTPNFTSSNGNVTLGSINDALSKNGSADGVGSGNTSTYAAEGAGRAHDSDDDGTDYAPAPSFSGARGRRLSQLAGTAMEVGCEVWAKLSNAEDWVKATVLSITGFEQKSKVRGRVSFKKLSKFILELHDAEMDPYNTSSGEQVEVISAPVEGSLEEFELVKLRNEEDDDPTAVEGVEDLIRLSYLHEPAILHMLRQRFERNLIYTNTGPILIAVNPFKPLSVYSAEHVDLYRQAGSLQEFNSDLVARPAPHVFQIADDAYRSMVANTLLNASKVGHSHPHHMPAVMESHLLPQNQSILVSGESGAGKTETTKFIMRYLADITRAGLDSSLDSVGNGGSKQHSIESQVLQSNPILECFGNARTLRNDNSSRFGKFIEINFSHRGKDDFVFRITGATIRTYLLEKVRLVRQARGERNYHCFYEIMAGCSQEELAELGLTDTWRFYYTNQSDMHERLDGVKDSEQFKITRNAMDVLGFTDDEQAKVLKVAAAVLHAGNITFDVKAGGSSGEDDGSSVSLNCYYHFQMCCSLLELDESTLEKALCVRTIVTPEQVYDKMVSVEEAEYARDAFAKTIYGALFDWLVQRVNRTIAHQETQANDSKMAQSAPTRAQTGGQQARVSSKQSMENKLKRSFIGVLDIFGFENFDMNSFEQLCINYTNETLQQHFNQFVFKHEQALYDREGINWSFIRFPDNSDVLDLLENRRTGLFAICDEQLRFPKSTDKTCVNKFYEICGEHPRFSAGSKERADDVFVVQHFAGPVRYYSHKFLEKNHDVVRPDMAQLVRSSPCWLVNSLVDFFRVEEESSSGHHGANPTGATNRLQPPGSTSAGGNAAVRNASSRAVMGRANTLRASGYTKIQTLSGEFKSQLEELMVNINTTSPHYIRCLKPNSNNVGDEFNDPLIVSQLRCGGVLEAVRVSRAGYPKRMSHEDFVKAYEFYAWKTGSRPAHSRGARDIAKEMCGKVAETALMHPQFVPSEDALGQTDKFMLAGIQCGKTTVFLRSRTFDFLERERLLYHRQQAVKIQSHFRKYSAMNSYRVATQAILVVQCCLRKFLATVRVNHRRLFMATRKIQRSFRGHQIRSLVTKMKVGFRRLQATYRGWICREGVKEYKRFFVAARMIQCLARRRAAKRRLRERRQEARSLERAMSEKEELAKRLAETQSKWQLEKDALMGETESELALLKEQLEITKASQMAEANAASNLRNTLDYVQNEKARLADEVELLKRTGTEKDKKYLEAMEVELETTRADVMLFRDRGDLLEVQTVQLREDLEVLQELPALLEAASAEVISLKQQLADKVSQIDDLEEAVLANEREADSLAEERDAARLETEQVKTEMASLEENIVDLKNTIITLEKGMALTEDNVTAANAERDALKEQVEAAVRELEATVSSAELKQKQVNEMVESLQRDMLTASEEVKNLSDTNDALTRTNEDLQLRLALLKDAASSDESNRQKHFDTAVADIQAELAQVEDAKKIVDEENDALERKCGDLEERLNAAQHAAAREKELTEVKLQEADMQLKIAEDTCRALEERCGQKEDEVSVLRDQVDTLEEANRKLQLDLLNQQQETDAAVAAANSSAAKGDVVPSKGEDEDQQTQLLATEDGKQHVCSDNVDLLARIAELEKELQDLRLNGGHGGEATLTPCSQMTMSEANSPSLHTPTAAHRPREDSGKRVGSVSRDIWDAAISSLDLEDCLDMDIEGDGGSDDEGKSSASSVTVPRTTSKPTSAAIARLNEDSDSDDEDMEDEVEVNTRSVNKKKGLSGILPVVKSGKADKGRGGNPHAITKSSVSFGKDTDDDEDADEEEGEEELEEGRKARIGSKTDKKAAAEVKAIKDKLLKSTVKIDVLTDENEMLQRSLQEASDELEYARNQVVVLQERLTAAYKRSGRGLIPADDSMNKPPGTSSPPPASARHSTSGQQRVSIAPSPLRPDEDPFPDDRSDLSNESDHLSLTNIPPSSSRKPPPRVPNYPSGAGPMGRGLSRGQSVGSTTGGEDIQPQPSMQRRISAAFSQRLSSMDGGGSTVGLGRSSFMPLGDDISCNGLGSVVPVGSGPIYREKDTIMCKRLSEWLIKSAGIVPSRAANYAVLLLQNGHGNTKRLARALAKDDDCLLALGVEEDDADEIVEALKAEFQPGDTSPKRDDNMSPHLPSGFGTGTGTPVSSQPPQSASPLPPTQLQDQQGHPFEQQYYSTYYPESRPSYLPQQSGGSLSPHGMTRPLRLSTHNRAQSYSPPRPTARSGALGGKGAYNRQSSSSSIRSLASFSVTAGAPDILADREQDSSPDKAFREARRARLETQASMTAEAARKATLDAERVTGYGGGHSFSGSSERGRTYSRSPSAANTPTTPGDHLSQPQRLQMHHEHQDKLSPLPRHSSRTALYRSGTSMNGVAGGLKHTHSQLAMEHEKAYLASIRARDASFLDSVEAALLAADGGQDDDDDYDEEDVGEYHSEEGGMR